MLLKCFYVALLSVLLVGCEDPETRYFDEIIKAGFIPYRHPVNNAGSGLIIRGKPDNILMAAPPTRCFPNQKEGKPTELRWYSDTSLPSTHYESNIKFDFHLNTIAQAGSPLINFKLSAERVKTVDFEFNGATIEMIDQLRLERYWNEEMDSSCKGYLLRYPFVLNGLQVSQMTFIFRDMWGGKISLDLPALEQIVDIQADVAWHIENNYKLVIDTPKFIGYHLSQLREEDQGWVTKISTEVKDDDFLWVIYDF